MLSLKGKKIDLTPELVAEFGSIGATDVTEKILNEIKAVPDFSAILRKHAKIQAWEGSTWVGKSS